MLTTNRQLRVSFGHQQTNCSLEDNDIHVRLSLPILETTSVQPLILDIAESSDVYQNGLFHLIASEHYLMGALVKPQPYPLDSSTYDVYTELLNIAAGWQLCRIWNYVPHINHEGNDLENYKLFCKGRSHAFEQFHGEGFNTNLPAGTGVGISEDVYGLYFVAVKDKIVNVENPEQVSAFLYPNQYGPRSPSFARGTLATINHQPTYYLSGTASIKGHESVGKGDIVEQFQITLDNMRLVWQQMGLDHQALNSEVYDCQFTIYLRHQSDFAIVQKMVASTLSPAHSVLYLNTEICRSELDIEIESTIKKKQK